MWRLHRAIGMGGDQLVPAVGGDDVEQRLGDRLRADWAAEFDAMIGEIRPFDGVRELLDDVRRRGFRLVLASSGKAAHVDHYLSLFGGAEAGAREVFDSPAELRDRLDRTSLAKGSAMCART